MTHPSHIARARALPIPSEHDEQCALIRWCAIEKRRYPELALLFAVPNGGKRHVVVANKLRADGVKSGVPDLVLPVARGQWHGLFIEMKRQKGGSVSEDQHEWLVRLRLQGYRTEVCKGWQEARAVLMDYLGPRSADRPQDDYGLAA